jgi:hypothetical protein
LQSAYHWINAGGIVKIDAYDEVNKHANSDVTIIFQDKRGVDKHKARFKNTYEFTRDATLSKSTTIVADVSAAMEAMNAD